MLSCLKRTESMPLTMFISKLVPDAMLPFQCLTYYNALQVSWWESWQKVFRKMKYPF